MTAGSCQSDTRQTFAEAWRKSRAERYWVRLHYLGE
jgi:hypothetical protein